VADLRYDGTVTGIPQPAFGPHGSLPVVVTTHRSGKAIVDDTRVLDDGFKGVPCPSSSGPRASGRLP
jgi:hypothetical protein